MQTQRKTRNSVQSSGFSLVEILISIAIQSIVILVIVHVAMQLSQTLSEIEEHRKSEETGVNLAYQLRSVLGQAVDVNWAGPANLNGGCCAPGKGRIRQYDAYSLPPTTAVVDTLGVFWREWAGSDGAMTSDFRPTAFYYQRPTIRTSGVVYIDVGGTGALSPSADDLMFDGVVGFAIRDAQLSANGSLSALRIQFTTRRYRSAKGDWSWCPPQFMSDPSCVTTQAYKDIDTSIEIRFRDNVLGPAPFAPTGFSRIYDQLYFFRTSLPLARTN